MKSFLSIIWIIILVKCGGLLGAFPAYWFMTWCDSNQKSAWIKYPGSLIIALIVLLLMIVIISVVT